MEQDFLFDLALKLLLCLPLLPTFPFVEVSDLSISLSLSQLDYQ